MLNTFNAHCNYLDSCVYYIYAVVLSMPQFNNYWDMTELMDIYFRKFVESNSHISKMIAEDCCDIIELIGDKDYINYVRTSFTNDDDAYHYLAMVTQFYRMSNKFGLLSKNPYEICNLYNIVRVISSH